MMKLCYIPVVQGAVLAGCLAGLQEKVGAGCFQINVCNGQVF